MPDLLERLKSALEDRYVVESEIGRGGMAVVFLAEDLRHHRQVALKVLHPELTATLGAERFLQEIETIASLNHPHILPLHDSGEAEGLLYYVMPYAEGESLRQRLDREKQLAVDESVRIAVEVADGLDYAHRKGVVHRDIKPGNILLSERHAVIADFGIARAIEVARADRVTSTGLGVGTPLYASPEQATAQETLDGRTDIYSLGCVLYEMLAGQPPLTGATPQMIQARRVSETPSALHDLRDTVPPALDHVIARALARIPADRYATASQFAQALQAVLFGSTPALGVDTATTPSAKVRVPEAEVLARWKAPARWLTALVGIAAIAAVVAVVSMMTTDRAATRDVRLLPVGADLGDQSIAILPFANNTGADSLDWYRFGLADMLNTDLSQLETIRVVGYERLLSLMLQAGREESDRIPEDLALNIAAASGARTMIRASVAGGGSGLRLDVRLIDVSDGTTIAAEQARGPDVLALVDDVSARLLSHVLGQTVSATELTPLSQLATGNLPAYREYQAGLLTGGRFLYQRSMEHYQQAVALDSTFALAWLRLGMQALTLGNGSLALSSVQRAEKYSASSPIRDRLLIQAFLARVSRDWDESISYFEELVERYPDDKEVRYHLGLTYRFHDRTDDGIRMQEAALRLDPYYIPALNELANQVAFFAGDEARADSLSLRYIELEPDQPNPYDTRGEILEEFGRHEEAREMFREATRRDSSWPWSLGRLVRSYLRAGDPAGARKALLPFQTAAPTNVALYAWLLEADTYDAEGRYVDALETSRAAAEKAGELGRDDSRLSALGDVGAWANATGAYGEAEEVYRELYRLDPYRRGVMSGILRTFGNQKQFDEMTRVRDEATAALDNTPESMRGRAEGREHFADGLIAWYRDGDAENTVRLIGEVRVVAGLSETAFTSNEEVLALVELGRVADALAIIDRREEIRREQVRHVLMHDTWYLRGRAHEALGETEKALESYERLLKVAGQGVLEVGLFRDMPERVARLRGEQ